jgi:hypothetical protein
MQPSFPLSERGSMSSVNFCKSSSIPAFRSSFFSWVIKPGTRYDAKEYVQLLVSAGETLLGVFGYTKSMIEAETLYHKKQVLLS